MDYRSGPQPLQPYGDMPPQQMAPSTQPYAQQPYTQQPYAQMPPPAMASTAGYPGYGQPVAYGAIPPLAGAPVADPRKGQAVTGFVLSLIGLIMMFFDWMPGLVWIDLILLIAGLVFSGLGMKSTTSRGLAIAGLVLSIIGVVIVGLVMIIIGMIVAAITHPHF